MLLGALLALPLSACQLLSDDGQERERGTAPTRERDQELVEAAIAVETQLVRLLRPLTGTGPERDRDTARTSLRIHQEHLELLGGAPSSQGGSQQLGRKQQRRQRARVARAEERASRRHRDAAVGAASGPFARVLAGMAAASAQQAQVWRA